ncbi:MAG TPA: adenylate/guanylate cyclase domain-containing protein [Roseiflexaceae bacterium]|nr:adenylate/guanylate cyclase domain-containing protein [Roseiflexaceae bacterium]
MENIDHIDPALLNRLHTYLPSDLFSIFAGSAPPPAAALAEACIRLRAELQAIASNVPAIILRNRLFADTPDMISGTYWNGSVLFADLSGFTALSARLSTLGKQGSEEISLIINHLFATLGDEIHHYSGTLLKFGGDALTAFFDAATLGDEHAAYAAHAALAMQQRMEAFAALTTPAGTFPLRLRIGVHSGQVFAAQVGDHSHIELVISGRNINRVAEAQEIAHPGEVVASRETCQLLGEIPTIARGGGFQLLSTAPTITPVPSDRLELRFEEGDDLAALVHLLHQIDMLRPFLPYGLPRRFLDLGDGSAEIGEFRSVSVMFVNFFPFNEALSLLIDDAGLAAHVLNAYYRRAQATIHRYGGIVNKVDMYTRGDKLMALFGAPMAHEDDPERCVRCALELHTALEDANAEIYELLQPYASSLVAIRPQFLSQQIGINTGVVFAGRVGAEQRYEYSVMGQPVNLAARLMSVASPGRVVISGSTRRAIEGRFELHDLPPAQLKGIPDPVPIAEALHVRSASGDRQAHIGRAAMVGRMAEQQQILATAAEALGGSGRVVALIGDAGVGKSRLSEEILQQLAHTMQAGGVSAFQLYTVESQSYDQNTPYATLRHLLVQILQIRQLDATVMIAELQQRIEARLPGLSRFTPLLSDILGLDIEDTPLTAALSAEQRHDRLQELVEAILFAEAGSQPLLLLFDDLQWSDASSLAMIERLARRLSTTPICMLLAYRSDPPIPQPWLALPHTLQVVLGELTPDEGAALIHELLPGALAVDIDLIIERTQGNPFFLEEVIRSLVESGALQYDGDRWLLTDPADSLALPDSVEGVITARLDRLEEPTRDVLHVAAVIGRRFAFLVLDGVMAPRPDLSVRLLQLSQADLISSEADVVREAATAYLFKHALTRDVAYEAILFARRRELHRRVGLTIEQLATDRLAEQLGLLARHGVSVPEGEMTQSLAEDWDRAFDYHVRAGEQAQQRFANREAITFFERALEIAPRLPSMMPQPVLRRSADTAQIADLHERLGDVLTLIGEYDAALQHYQAALVLHAAPDVPVDRVRLHHLIARVYEKRSEFDTAFEWVERGLQIDTGQQNAEQVRCLLLGAGIHQRQGRYQQALEWGERAQRVAADLGSVRDQAHALKLLGGTYFNLGELKRAHELTSQSLPLYRTAQELSGLADAYNDVGIFCQELGRLTEASNHFSAAAEIKQAIGDVYGQAMIANNLGSLLLIQGQFDEAIPQFRQSLLIFERLGSSYAAGVLHMNLGSVYLLRDELDAAEAQLRTSGDLFQQVGAEEFLPELLRYVADLALRRGEYETARRTCERSIETAARLEARAEEGISRRTLGLIMARPGDLTSAWSEFELSLALLRDAASLHEVARTLLALAEIAPALDQYEIGRAALAEAMPALEAIGAQRDVSHGYAISRLYPAA